MAIEQVSPLSTDLLPYKKPITLTVKAEALPVGASITWTINPPSKSEYMANNVTEIDSDHMSTNTLFCESDKVSKTVTIDITCTKYPAENSSLKYSFKIFNIEMTTDKSFAPYFPPYKEVDVTNKDYTIVAKCLVEDETGNPLEGVEITMGGDPDAVRFYTNYPNPVPVSPSGNPSKYCYKTDTNGECSAVLLATQNIYTTLFAAPPNDLSAEEHCIFASDAMASPESDSPSPPIFPIESNNEIIISEDKTEFFVTIPYTTEYDKKQTDIVLLINNQVVYFNTLIEAYESIPVSYAVLDNSGGDNSAFYFLQEGITGNVSISKSVDFKATGNPLLHPDPKLPHRTMNLVPYLDGHASSLIQSGIYSDIGINIDTNGVDADQIHVNSTITFQIFLNGYKNGTNQAKSNTKTVPALPYVITQEDISNKYLRLTVDKNFFKDYGANYNKQPGTIEVDFVIESQDKNNIYRPIKPLKLPLNTCPPA